MISECAMLYWEDIADKLQILLYNWETNNLVGGKSTGLLMSWHDKMTQNYISIALLMILFRKSF